MADHTFTKMRRIGGKAFKTSRTVNEKGKVEERKVSQTKFGPGRASRSAERKTEAPGTSNEMKFRSVKKSGTTPGGRNYSSEITHIGGGSRKNRKSTEAFHSGTDVVGKKGTVWSKEDRGKHAEKFKEKNEVFRKVKRGPTKKEK